MTGFVPKTLVAGSSGILKFEDVKAHITDDVAAMMITNPNTLGLFESDIEKIAQLLHDHGAFLYMDGANFNAILGVVRPGDFGVDVLQSNLHKTFSTPHGGGGPGSGPVMVCKKLEPYLPVPFVEKNGDTYSLSTNRPKSIGPVKSFYGQFGMFVRAYCYILAFGKEHLPSIGKNAVLNANYLLSLLRKEFSYTMSETCMHEFVLSDKAFKASGVTTLDIAKALIDRGYHPPTIYFPLVVSGALMIEPTETESKTELDTFAATLLDVLREAREGPEKFKNLPQKSFIGKVDEAQAARKLCLCDPDPASY
jgi:glycine dehydrogenase subunit 2